MAKLTVKGPVTETVLVAKDQRRFIAKRILLYDRQLLTMNDILTPVNAARVMCLVLAAHGVVHVVRMFPVLTDFWGFPEAL